MASLTTARPALNTGAYDVDAVRNLAKLHNRTELLHHEPTKLISFQADFHEGDDRYPKGSYDRVDVWYGTGTVATVVDHPTKRRNQMFRGQNAPQDGARPMSLEDLDDIFKNPRVHTDAGYRRKGKKPNKQSNSESDSDGSWQDVGGENIGKLSKKNLAKLEKGSATRRQFNCPEHGTWWRKCIPTKAVSKCKSCHVKYDAVPEEEERGRGLFTCTGCGNEWTSNTACRGLAQYCQAENCTLRDKQIGSFPIITGKQLERWQIRLRQRAWEKHVGVGAQSSRRTSLGSRAHAEGTFIQPARPNEPSSGGGLGEFSANSGGNYRDANDGGGEYRGNEGGGFDSSGHFNDAGSTTPESSRGPRKPSQRPHWCTGCASGKCKAAPVHSCVHVSTGSTATSISGATWSSRASTTGSLGSFHGSQQL